MSFKPKSHKGMVNEEWMARLRAFASDGVWPSNAGNRPAPRQKKWHALYQKIEKCPIQSRGQTTLFGVSVTCDCGFHAAEPAFQPPPPPVAPQSVASESTSSAPRSLLRAPPSISKFIKSRFGGSHTNSLKPNLVAQKPPGPSPSSVRSPSLIPSSVKTSGPSPSSVRTPSLTPSSVRTSGPSPSSARTPSLASSSTTPTHICQTVSPEEPAACVQQ
ncbi:hypothetical protein AMECASPLE_028492 [Ameca splendens]|uniref:Myb proto-oncogene protein, plant n=1 Tax=Ameca splendens TaxID=208324 RepID=A0ABV1ABT9_9TELE